MKIGTKVKTNKLYAKHISTTSRCGVVRRVSLQSPDVFLVWIEEINLGWWIHGRFLSS